MNDEKKEAAEETTVIEADRIDDLAEAVIKQSKLLDDLVEFLERTKVLPGLDPSTWLSWRGQLEDMRREDAMQLEIKKAKQFLEREGYIVAENENALDAQKLKLWVESKDGKDTSSNH